MSQPQENKLLSDEELREAVLSLGVCGGPYDTPHRCSAMHCEHCGLCDVSEELIKIIQSQKLAWADMVINTKMPLIYLEEDESYELYHRGQKELRAKQRERNKL